MQKGGAMGAPPPGKVPHSALTQAIRLSSEEETKPTSSPSHHYSLFSLEQFFNIPIKQICLTKVSKV